MNTNLVDLVHGRSGHALTAGDVHLSYADLTNAAAVLAERLRERGLRTGDVVSILLPNSPGFVVAYLACWYAGLIANPLNSRQSVTELVAVVRHAGSRLLITGHTFEMTAHTCADAGSLPTLVVEENAPEVPKGPPPLDPVSGGSRAAVLIYTSGTTSAPKGVLLSHANLITDARGIADRLGVGPEYRTTCVMPLFHCNALIFSHLSTFTVGGSVQLQPKFSASRLWDQVEEFGSHSFSCPPTVLAMLLERTPEQRPTPDSLRFVKVGAAPLAEPLAAAFERRFGVPLIEGYGMTEGTATSVMHDPRRPRPAGTVGHVLAGQRIRIADEQGVELPVGQVGEIHIGGETVMLGYHHNPEATAATIVDGWLRTGDLGALDEDGNLRLAGRAKELIIRGGENIFPATLDHVLESHPDVSEGAAYGIPDPIWGESPAAAVVSRDGVIDLDNLHEFVRARVADFAVPVEYRVLPSIPRNAVGKIRRHELTRTHADATPTTGSTTKEETR